MYIPIWLATIHSRKVVSLGGRWPSDVETQTLISDTEDCGCGYDCEDAFFAMAQEGIVLSCLVWILQGPLPNKGAGYMADTEL